MDTPRRTYRKICQHCGKEFIAYTSVTAYCSHRCSGLADKLRKRNDRLKSTTTEVRELQRQALLDKNFLTLTDAAKLMQISRTTLYRIIKLNSIPLKRFTDRTVRISREDLDKAANRQVTLEDTTITEKEDILTNWMTKEQIMEEYGITMSWLYSTTKRLGIQPRIIGCKNFYNKAEIDKAFTREDYSDPEKWYTFDQLREQTGMRTESICDFCNAHKIDRERKNGTTYVSKRQWDNARGTNIDKEQYITMKEITATYGLSRNHLYTIFKENGIERVKFGNFVYFNREEVRTLLTNRKQNGRS